MEHLYRETHPAGVGLPTLRGRRPGDLRRYAVACRASAVIAARQGKHDLVARLTDLAAGVECSLEDLRRADVAATA